MKAHIFHRRQKRALNQSGFTLIEALVAMAFFSVAITGILAMLAQSVKNNERSYLSTMMNAVIYEQVDTLISLPYTDTNLTVGTHPNIALINRVPQKIRSYQPAISWAVSNTDNIVQGSKMVVVTVSWVENGRQKQRDLNLIKTRDN